MSARRAATSITFAPYLRVHTGLVRGERRYSAGVVCGGCSAQAARQAFLGHADLDTRAGDHARAGRIG